MRQDFQKKNFGNFSKLGVQSFSCEKFAASGKWRALGCALFNVGQAVFTDSGKWAILSSLAASLWTCNQVNDDRHGYTVR
jgi:hypothetical protein